MLSGSVGLNPDLMPSRPNQEQGSASRSSGFERLGCICRLDLAVGLRDSNPDHGTARTQEVCMHECHRVYERYYNLPMTNR